MRKYYLLSSFLGFISTLIFFILGLSQIKVQNLIDFLTKLIFNPGESSIYAGVLFFITTFILLIFIFFLVTLIIWASSKKLRNKYYFSYLLKINLFFIIGTIIFFLFFAFSFRVGPV
mgnify:CR=1 FL=1